MEASHELARDIANEHGLVWKIWLEDRATGHAGGIYLFEDATAAQRYREKHERRLSAMGLTGVTANAFSVNTELSVLTMAGAALARSIRSKSVSRCRRSRPNSLSQSSIQCLCCWARGSSPSSWSRSALGRFSVRTDLR